MAQLLLFQAALDRIGFNGPSVTALTGNGINSVRDLINLTTKDIEQILKIVRTGPPPVVVPYLAQSA